MIGSFFQPEAIYINTGFLSTLPKKEWMNGLSEILKYGAIRDRSIFEMCSQLFLDKQPVAEDSKLVELIRKCTKIKADIVALDEKESGLRMILNFGHTFAHALEKACDFETISHGEAVFLGMMAAQKLSVLTGADLPGSFFDPFRPLYQFRVNKEALSSEDIYSYMFSDKKRTDQYLKFVLLEKWQSPAVKTVKDKRLIDEAVQRMLDEL